jgi:hypothetical protein
MVSDLLGYAELAELTGRSVGALRVARSKGRLPEPDEAGPPPKWRRATVEEFLKEGGRVRAGDGTAAPGATSEPPASPATPEPVTPSQAAPVASCLHPKQERVLRPWGAFCGACGRLVR